ncbi:hypothetical protein BC835DRAFT_715763 [Cytidiella melzeri]|nr:hypothetical protein BC835DRAFT_715763 [Cytidiella melzeri]
MQNQWPTIPGMQLLPQEVAENIFLALDGDFATLSNCILVSRVWAALSYPVRFRQVAFSACEAALEKNHDARPRTFSDFLTLLCQSPRLCHCVRELTLKSQSSVGILDIAILQNIISRLPFLASLEIAEPYLYLSHASYGELPRPVHLRKLTIGKDCLWRSQESLSGLLNLFDEIDEVVHFVSTTPMESKPGFTIVRPSANKLQIKSLSFVHGRRPVQTKTVESCLSVYSQLLAPSTFTSFAVDPGYLSMDELKSYGRFVGEFGKSVRDFRCGVYCRGPMGQGADIISNIPSEAQTGVLTVQYSAGLEFSWWCQRVVTCGWDNAVGGLLRAPASVRTMRLTLATSGDFLVSFEGSCVTPQAGLLKLLDTLYWPVIERIIEGHQYLERMQLELQGADCVYSEAEQQTFEKECQGVVLSRFTRHPRALQVLRVIVV